MHRRFFCISVLTGLGLLIPLAAQEGHPMTGTWHGDWGSSPTQRTRIVLYMKWDSKNVTGMINPGPRAIPLTTATLDASKWSVHLEGDGKDQAGNPVHVVADGKMDNIGSYNRTITGTWAQGSAKGDFKVTRD
ncbi:MAG: hypothetical protein JO307_28375 [Bryobacterales bacterium]|nr:hypothetical protein [Bryobacterales bacterium]MBV9400849.1 hypothetical protein [Bryobacterales bacterium]